MLARPPASPYDGIPAPGGRQIRREFLVEVGTMLDMDQMKIEIRLLCERKRLPFRGSNSSIACSDIDWGA
jgi:hypothetical protein